MDLSTFLQAHADEIVERAVASVFARHLDRYEKLGREEAARRLRALFDLVVEGARTRDLGPIGAHAERIGAERFESGFELIEVQAAFTAVEEASWRALMAGYPQQGLAHALGMVATLLGAAKDRLAATWLTLATHTHVPSLDLESLFRGTQNTGGGQAV